MMPAKVGLLEEFAVSRSELSNFQGLAEKGPFGIVSGRVLRRLPDSVSCDGMVSLPCRTIYGDTLFP